MSRVGGGWIVPQDVEPGEEVVWSRSANRMQDSRAVGGKLFVTNRRILFSPHRADALTGGRPWSVGLTDVADIGVEPKGSGKAAGLGGGLRDRLRIRTTAGEDLFVVNKLTEEVIPTLTEATTAAKGAN